jgi:hypothetical protein
MFSKALKSYVGYGVSVLQVQNRKSWNSMSSVSGLWLQIFIDLWPEKGPVSKIRKRKLHVCLLLLSKSTSRAVYVLAAHDPSGWYIYKSTLFQNTASKALWLSCSLRSLILAKCLLKVDQRSKMLSESIQYSLVVQKFQNSHQRHHVWVFSFCHLKFAATFALSGMR